MWSLESGAGCPRPGAHKRGLGEEGRLLRLLAALLLAGLTAACFQPLYGEHSLTGGPGLRGVMARVDIAQIEATPGTALARLAVEVRNELQFGLTGGAAAAPPTHRLAITLTTATSS